MRDYFDLFGINRGPVSRLIREWRSIADYPLATVSGNPVSFSDGAAKAVESCVVSMSPVQDLNGYSNPWPGGGGANQWDEEWEVGGINHSTGEDRELSSVIRSVGYIPCEPDTSYYFANTGSAGSGGAYIHYYNADKDYIGYEQVAQNNTFTTISNARYIRFNMTTAYGTEYGHNISINYPASVTTYSPYSNICPISEWDSVTVTLNDTAHTISLPATVYGGTVDAVTGEGSSTYGAVDMGSLTWTKGNRNNADTGYVYYSTSLSSAVADRGDAVCSILEKVAPMAWENLACNTFSIVGKYVVAVLDVDTVDDFVTAVTGQTLVYELATPTPITTDPVTDMVTLDGDNTIFTDADELTVTYHQKVS